MSQVYFFFKRGKTMKIDIGNDGYVELLETFGSDLTIVNAARVSFNKESTEFTERDAKLIKYLAKHEHVSPFFHPQLRCRIKMPIFVAREWFRHTVGFARNEVSRRYVDTKPEIWVPTEFRQRDPNLKQGSKSETVEHNELTLDVYKKAVESALFAYDSLLEANVAPEMARAILPLGLYTEFIETGSLAAYARLCNLRLDESAQKEIRDFAQAIHELIKDKFPNSWQHLIREIT
jgi:thymidylate synthase (FAD)